MVRLSAVCFVALSAFALAGCQSAGKQKPTAPIPSDLTQLARWQAQGRIGVSGPGGGGSGSFDWQQQADRANVQIRGPVGIGSLRLEVSGAGERPALKLTSGDGKALESDAAWDELEARLGAPVPAGNLRYWMLGLAAPGAHQWTEANGVRSLEQGGWRIDYQKYSDEFGAHVPMTMRASGGDTRVRIVVNRWQLGQ
jgi:outer membrane lipoprotein LolB